MREAKSVSEKRSQPMNIYNDVTYPTNIDRMLHASVARFTLGLSPAALWLAYADWAIHFWASPGEGMQNCGVR